MAWNGSGTYSRTNGVNSGATTWADDAAAAVKIRADRHDTHDEDIATAISACLTKNMETKPTADFVPNVTTTYDLGTSSLKWEDLHLNGVATIGGNLLTDADSTNDIGATGTRWKDLYIDSITTTDTITIGGNSVSPTVEGAVTATTSGTEHEYTSIPAWATKIHVMLSGVSTNGTADVKFQLGDAGGYETTGYVSFAVRTADAGTNVTTATGSFKVDSVTAAGDAITGMATFTLMDSSTNTWACYGQFGKSSSVSSTITGVKPLSAALDRIQLTADGVDTFDAGSFNIRYE